MERIDELQPYEPIIYFDMGNEDKLNINLGTNKACKFIKIVPTAFRSQPINYADCQDFSKD